MKIDSITVKRDSRTALSRDNPLGQDRGYNAKVVIKDEDLYYTADATNRVPDEAVFEAFNACVRDMAEKLRRSIRVDIEVEFG